MTGTLRLFTIEARRSIALWFFPLMTLVACWYANSRLTPIGISLWRHNSTQIGETLLVLAPLVGGVAAWASGRDRRRGIGDLLGTTPRPFSHRVLAGWGGVVVWGVVAYVTVGIYVVAVSLRDDAWGSPMAAPVAIGVLAIVAASAIGYLVGSVVPNRLVAPLVPIALFFTITLLSSGWFHDDPVSYLSPWTLIDRQLALNPDALFYTAPSVHLLPMTLWLVGLTGLALATIVLVQRRGPVALAALIGATIVASTGAGLLMNAYDHRYLFGLPWEHGEPVAYTPVCVERSVPVCVHPAFEPQLDAYADQLDQLIEPLLGLSGAPVRAEQLPYASGMYADGTLTIDPVSSSVEFDALALVQDNVEPGPGWKMQHHVESEQAVIATWLAHRVDAGAFEYWSPVVGPAEGRAHDEIDAAVARFSALDTAAQRAWLEANYVDLRAGRLSLDDLP